MVKRYLYYFGWTVGFFCVLYLANRSFQYFDTRYEATFNLPYNLWIWGTIPILAGIYFSFYKGIPKGVAINSSQLVILILSFIVSIYPFLTFYLGVPVVPFVFIGLYSYYGYFLVSFLFGFSLSNTFLKW